MKEEKLKEEYEPTKREIFYEMVKITGKGARDFGVGLGAGAIMPLAGVCMPSFIRYCHENTSQEEKFNLATFLGMVISGAPATWISGVCSIYLIGNNPEYSLIPITTNLVSGIYELMRKAKKNLEQKV